MAKRKRINRKDQDARLSCRVSPGFRKYLSQHAEKYKISQSDLIEVCVKNTIEGGLIFSHTCLSCGNVEWHDNNGHLKKMYEVSFDNTCIKCGAKGEKFTKYP